MSFQIVGDALPDDAKRAGRGGQLDQAAAFMRDHPGKWVVVDTRPTEQAARNLAKAIDDSDRAAFKLSDADVEKGARYEGGYKSDGTVIGAYFPPGWDDRDTELADSQYQG